MSKRYPFTAIKEKLAARQGKALDFAVGKRRLELPEAIDTWVRANAQLALEPGTRAEVDGFCEAAAALLEREYGAVVAPQNILPTPGGRAAMSAFVACALEPGDAVLVTEPGYPAFARLATHRHARVHEVPLDSANGFVPDFQAALGRGATAPRVVAVNYPNNPTGATLTPEVATSIDKVADDRTIIFNDATYGPLAYKDSPISLLGEDVVGNAGQEKVELHSFYKLFPLGPIALSFLAGSEETMQHVSTYSEFAWSPPSKLQLRATTMCLQDADRLRKLREFFPARLEPLRQLLSDIGFNPFPAPAGVYVLCSVPSQVAGQVVTSAEEAAAQLMDKFDLAVVPFDTSQFSYLRFSSLYLDEDFDKLSRLRGAMQFS
jgi:aspartate/methionine/tyrosine aminotransferase